MSRRRAPSRALLVIAGLIAGLLSTAAVSAIVGASRAAAQGAGPFVYSFGDAQALPGPGSPAAPLVGMSPTTTSPGQAPSYSAAGSNASTYPLASGAAQESYSGPPLARPIVGIAAPNNGMPGWWLVGSDGGVFAYGGATFLGSAGGIHLNQPIVSLAATPDGHGYWLVASDGGIFTYGDAGFFGSTGGIHLNQPIVGMAPSSDGRGYWLVAADGGIFTYGDAGFFGSTGGIHLNQPIVGMAPSSDGRGYWMVARDGGVFSFGDALFHGSAAGQATSSVVGIVADPSGGGYWLLTSGSPTPSPSPPGSGQTPPPPGKYPTEWSAAADGLSADVKVDTSTPGPNQIIHFTIDVHTQTWSMSPSMGFGNGNSAGPGVPGDEWYSPSGGACTAGPNEFVYHLDFAYRLAGDYTFQFNDARLDCTNTNPGHGQPVTVKGTIHVGSGPYLHNGPLPPVVALSGQFTPTNGDPSMVYEQEEAIDNDGWVDQISLDWGDGSPPYTRSWSPPPNCDPANNQPPRPEEWPSGGLASSTQSQQFLSHKYPHGGTYTVTATVHSEGCDGSEPQSASITETVNAPY